MASRIQFHEALPDTYAQLLRLHQQVEHEAETHGVVPKLIELVKIRASQINGCAFCVDMHVQQALNHGEQQRRIDVLPVWRESGLFAPAEGAALALTEEITRTSAFQEVSAQVYNDAAALFTESQLAVVVWAASVIQVFNALNVTSRKTLPQTR